MMVRFVRSTCPFPSSNSPAVTVVTVPYLPLYFGTFNGPTPQLPTAVHSLPVVQLSRPPDTLRLARTRSNNPPKFSATPYSYPSYYDVSLSNSKDTILRNGLRDLSLDNYVEYAVRLKGIKAAPSFANAFSQAVTQIRGYQSLHEECERLRSIAFNASDEQHLDILRGLVSKRWTDMGFQGNCPATDFRGMGLLGALNLLYFAESHTTLARGILSASVLSTSSYPFAIVGISLTDLLRKWLRDGELKCHFFNYVGAAPTLDDFNFAYVCLFSEFHAFWVSESRDIMQFNAYRREFEAAFEPRIRSNDFVFQIVPLQHST
ncbi:ELMO domain-containing protein 1 [Sparganum proliferum]